jgi:hypothetical protein
MRPGQSRPIVHLEPARSPSGVALRLDGQDLDPIRAADVRLVSYEGSGQTSLELQRDLAAGVPHRLEASYPLALTDAGGRFFADVNDIEGRGNEALFPTLNTPHELARHVLVFRVHAAEPYLAVGSGLVAARAGGDVQEWVLERSEVAYTVMFRPPPRSHLLHDGSKSDGASSCRPGASPRRKPSPNSTRGSRSWRARSAPSPCRAA